MASVAAGAMEVDTAASADLDAAPPGTEPPPEVLDELAELERRLSYVDAEINYLKVAPRKRSANGRSDERHGSCCARSARG